MSDAEVTIANLPPLDEDAREDAAFRGQDRAWSSLVGLFDHYQGTQKLTYEALGKRIKRSRKQVQRWLSSSFNMNLKSLGLLAEGLDADLIIEVRPRRAEMRGRNYCHPREAAKAQIGKFVTSMAATNATPTRIAKTDLASSGEVPSNKVTMREVLEDA